LRENKITLFIFSDEQAKYMPDGKFRGVPFIFQLHTGQIHQKVFGLITAEYFIPVRITNIF